MRDTLRHLILGAFIIILLFACGVANAESHPSLITIIDGQSVGDGSYIGISDSGYPFIMHFTLDENTMPAESCKLGIYSWDCDWMESKHWNHEYDMVFVNGSFVGVLTGQNETWKTSYMDVPISLLKTGDNTITIYIGHQDNSTGDIVQNSDDWLLTVQWASLQFDGGKSPNAPDSFSITLQYANRTENGIACGAHATIQSSTVHSYVIEYSLVDKTGNPATNNQIVAGDRENVSGTSIESTGHFMLDANAPMGNYQIQVTLRDPDTNEVYAYDSYTFDLTEAINGSCDHEKLGPAQFRRTEYRKLDRADVQYDTKHNCIDLYTYTCAKCGKIVEEYRNNRLENHTLPVCVCGYVEAGYNPILSATFAPVGLCEPGQQFTVTVTCNDSVGSISAYNDDQYPMADAWIKTDNGDGTVTFTRTYIAGEFEAHDRYWIITAFSNNHRKIGEKSTNRLDILFNVEEYPTSTDDDVGWWWFRSVKEFEDHRHDTNTNNDDNRISGRDEWQYMINFCETLMEAGFDDTFIQDCYEELASCKNERMRELILSMFSSDLIEVIRKTNNPDGTRWEGSSYQTVEDGQLKIVYNGNYAEVRTIFHEIGHAIDSYAAILQGNDEDGLYTVSDASIDQVKNDIETHVRSTVTKIVNETFKDQYILFFKTSDESATRESYIEYLTYKVMNENIPFAESAEQKYGITLTSELQDAYNKILSLYRTPYSTSRNFAGLSLIKGGNLVNEFGVDAYRRVISDVYGGVTNNNITDGYGHSNSQDWNGSSYYYWYQQNTTKDANGNTVAGSFIQDENGNAVFNGWTICEIWAEYTESIITDVWYTNEIVEEFFPTFNVESYVEQMHSMIAEAI